MIGVTVATPGWEDLAREAARRWTLRTRLPARVLYAADSMEAHWLKLSFNEPCWFFDADLWFINDARLPLLQPDLIYATPGSCDPYPQTFIQRWSKAGGIDRRCWFASGLIGADWTFGKARQALALAREYGRVNEIICRDEEPLNVGAQRAGAIVAFLPGHFNWCRDDYGYRPDRIIAVHAAGIIPIADKFMFLERQSRAAAN